MRYDEIPGVEPKRIQRGDSVSTAQVVKCNYCKATETIIKTREFKPATALQKMVTNKGWRWSKSGKHCCPKCIAKFKAIKMVKKDETAPREMTPADKRKIFREIDENYDEANSRYIGEATDQAIAKKLAVPSKWVSTVRDENFGPSGRNEEMERVGSALGRLAHESKAAADKALVAAEAAEKVKLECEDLRKRLEKLEASFGPRRVA